MVRRLNGAAWRPDRDKGVPGPKQLELHLRALARKAQGEPKGKKVSAEEVEASVARIWGAAVNQRKNHEAWVEKESVARAPAPPTKRMSALEIAQSASRLQLATTAAYRTQLGSDEGPRPHSAQLEPKRPPWRPSLGPRAPSALAAAQARASSTPPARQAFY